ncbi:hypothetical protein S40288_05685 [Stachybotrys chartarum IBT 40288]|nr:hypothetical protein S40288_05685 [Stachybotrys chartarum IBT 40288]
MTSNGSAEEPAPSLAQQLRQEDGPYVLRALLDDVPLSADGSQDDIKITCVDYWDCNLYVGTSASELLHFVRIPPDPSDPAGNAVYILASRLSPGYAEPATSRPGVQQILLLPRVNKACVLCNWTVTFYSLPELSPDFETPQGPTQVKNCNWIGGVDLNEPVLNDGNDRGVGVAMLLSLNRRIRVAHIAESAARVMKTIDFAGSTLTVRRDSIACVADSKSYALLDVERQLKIPLMNISALDESPPPGELGQAQSLVASTGDGVQRSASSAQNRPLRDLQSQGHGRSSSLGTSIMGNILRGEGTDSPHVRGGTPPPLSSSPQPPADAVGLPPPGAPSTPVPASDAVQKPRPVFLKPHIVSPTPEEFLVVTGTSPLEPGLGMFVNLDGDPTRSPLQFERYPKEVVVDSTSQSMASSRPGQLGEDEGFVLASVTRQLDDGPCCSLEIQRLGINNPTPTRYWLEAPEADRSVSYGLRTLLGNEEVKFEKVVQTLCQRRFSPFPGSAEASSLSLRNTDSPTGSSMERLSKEKELFEREFDSQDDESLNEGWEATRNSEGEEFARRFSKSQARLAVWSGRRIWWAIRNPLLIQLDVKLEAASAASSLRPGSIDRQAVLHVLASIREREPTTELEFLTFGYIRQKAGVLLLTSLLVSPEDEQLTDEEMNALEDGVVGSKVDPRVILSLIPGVRNEIIEGRRGIWIHGGVKNVADAFLQSPEFVSKASNPIGSLEPSIKLFLRRFLLAWRKMKGFGSVSDETEVFRTVDAALLLVLLELDQDRPRGLGRGAQIRSELFEVADKGVDCFDRAVDLLESYHRLYVLSRLYQSRKMAGDVLATWRRIVEGERDDGQELRDTGEQRVRDYLAKISNQSLVQEYGVWLANRNPKLGVQVFTENRGKAPKFEPARVVDILREHAPNAVKYYLEHLVFGKGHTAHVNELITYYLDVVVGDLESSSQSREAIMATYDAYRALSAPKPTYSHFLTDNAPPDDEVWQSRLRLLQLLGGNHNFDAAAIRGRIAKLPGDLLVPETIILAGRERHHLDALRLLVHKLGDYDTAVSYCLRGGSSIYLAQPGRRESMPSVEQQGQLFNAVLREFLAIEDVSDRVEQTGALLERFGGWFEIDQVLGLIPDSWSVDVIAGFLVGALRRLVRERHESKVTRALSGAQNLRVSYDLVVKVDEKGPTIEAPN